MFKRAEKALMQRRCGHRAAARSGRPGPRVLRCAWLDRGARAALRTRCPWRTLGKLGAPRRREGLTEGLA
jgi:hypothetical protein